MVSHRTIMRSCSRSRATGERREAGRGGALPADGGKRAPVTAVRRAYQVTESSATSKGATGGKSRISHEGGKHGEVRMPSLPLPHVSLPQGTAGHLLWWGGLAAVAAFGVVD